MDGDSESDDETSKSKNITSKKDKMKNKGFKWKKASLINHDRAESYKSLSPNWSVLDSNNHESERSKEVFFWN